MIAMHEAWHPLRDTLTAIKLNGANIARSLGHFGDAALNTVSGAALPPGTPGPLSLAANHLINTGRIRNRVTLKKMGDSKKEHWKFQKRYNTAINTTNAISKAL